MPDAIALTARTRLAPGRKSQWHSRPRGVAARVREYLKGRRIAARPMQNHPTRWHHAKPKPKYPSANVSALHHARAVEQGQESEQLPQPKSPVPRNTPAPAGELPSYREVVSLFSINTSSAPPQRTGRKSRRNTPTDAWRQSRASDSKSGERL